MVFTDKELSGPWTPALEKDVIEEYSDLVIESAWEHLTHRHVDLPDACLGTENATNIVVASRKIFEAKANLMAFTNFYSASELAMFTAAEAVGSAVIQNLKTSNLDVSPELRARILLFCEDLRLEASRSFC